MQNGTSWESQLFLDVAFQTIFFVESEENLAVVVIVIHVYLPFSSSKVAFYYPIFGGLHHIPPTKYYLGDGNRAASTFIL